MPEVALPDGTVISGTADEVAAILSATGHAPQPPDAAFEDGEYGRGPKARGQAVNERQQALASEYRRIREEHTSKDIDQVVDLGGDPRRRNATPP